MNQKGNISLLLILVLIFIIGASFYYFKSFFKRSDPEFGANQTLRVYQPVKTSYLMHAPENLYSLLISYEDDDKGERSCKKTLYDDHGSERHFENIDYFMENVGCRLGPGATISLDGFHNFSGFDMVFNLLGTEITILNVTTGEVRTLTYRVNHESQDYGFIAADTSLEYLLFSKDGYPYIDQIRNFDDKEVFNIQPLLNIGNNPAISSYYDSTNHGILYLFETERDYRFSYFDLQTRAMKQLRTVPRLELLGRGCPANILFTEKSRLRFLGSCLNISPDYKNTSGELIFNL